MMTIEGEEHETLSIYDIGYISSIHFYYFGNYILLTKKLTKCHNEIILPS